MWFVYLLRCADGSLYTGATNRLKHRLRAHTNGKAAKYPRSRRPVHLVRIESCINKSEALSREWTIKQMTKAQKEELVK
jgi:putative endonuclease